jgi:hypothetical protein
MERGGKGAICRRQNLDGRMIKHVVASELKANVTWDEQIILRAELNEFPRDFWSMDHRSLKSA